MNSDKLVNCFVESLAITRDQVNPGLTYQSVKQWDSVAHMALVAAIENSFDVMLDTDEILALSTVSKAKEILAKHGVQF